METRYSRGSAPRSWLTHHELRKTYTAATAANARPVARQAPRACQIAWTPTPASRITGSSGCSTSQANFSPAHEYTARLRKKSHTRKAASIAFRRHSDTAPIAPRISIGHSIVMISHE